MSWKRVLYVLFVVIVAGFSALAGVVAGGAAVYQAVRQDDRLQSALEVPVALPAENEPALVDISSYETTITQAVEKVGPAVVTVLANLPGQATFFGRTSDQQVSGSGVFISADGYVLTNNHVIEGADQVVLILADGSQLDASIVGTDLYADLAVLKTAGQVPAYAPLGNSDTLKPGETVIAIGSPLGDFKNTVTVGVVSATGRMIDTGRGYQIEDLIQTDAAINSGNSGGPLINLAGEVIGINTLVVRGNLASGAPAEGLGFAIPINTARAVAEQIVEQGFFARPYLGIRWQTITPDIAEVYNLPVDWGVYVTDVVTESPAYAAGVRSGDIIARIGDIKLDESHPFINALFSFSPGETVPLEVYRSSQRLELPVTLGQNLSG